MPRREPALELQVTTPHGSQRIDVVIHAGATLGERHPHGIELTWYIADTEPGFQTAAGEHVDRGEFLGEDDRVALGEDHDAGTQAQRRGVCRKVGESSHLIHEVGVGPDR